jgi:phosphoribosylglycinamide formyltransferase-1
MTPRLIFDPSSGPIKYACGVSGSGTNYDRIYERDPVKQHIIFSNAPACSGVTKAKARGVPVAILDSAKYFKEMWTIEKVPRYGAERNSYDMALMTLMEQGLGCSPDLICLAGYDLWIGEWMANRYFPRILNVHPGDAGKYVGLGWRPTAKAILADEKGVKSTVFFVDASDDGGPVLIQSRSLQLSRWDNELSEIRRFMEKMDARTIPEFREATQRERSPLYAELESVSTEIQGTLREEGDWQIYPFAVHDLIAKGRVALDGRTVYIDGIQMPPEGWQVDEFGFADKIN